MEKEVVSKRPRGQKRQSVSRKDRLLIINKDPNKVYRLVDADASRLFELQNMGYTVEQMSDHVPPGLRASNPTLVDNSLPVGGGKNQVLVSIPKEDYDAAQADKEAELKELEAGLKPNLSDGQYGKISIQN